LGYLDARVVQLLSKATWPRTLLRVRRQTPRDPFAVEASSPRELEDGYLGCSHEDLPIAVGHVNAE